MIAWPGDYWHETEAGHHGRESVIEKGCLSSWQPRSIEKREKFGDKMHPRKAPATSS